MPERVGKASSWFSADRVRPIALALVLLAALAYFAVFTNRSYPVEKWLFWRYAGYVLACAVFAMACTSTGHLVVRKVLGRALPFREHLGTSFTAGVFVFYLVISLAGFFHLYGAPLFFLLPAAMLAAGGRSLFRLTRRYARRAARLRARRPPGRCSPTPSSPSASSAWGSCTSTS